MFTFRIPEHVIDLSAPEEERWAQVIKSERVALRRIVRAAIAEYEEAGVPAWGRWLGSTALDSLYRLWGGPVHWRARRHRGGRPGESCRGSGR